MVFKRIHKGSEAWGSFAFTVPAGWCSAFRQSWLPFPDRSIQDFHCSYL